MLTRQIYYLQELRRNLRLEPMKLQEIQNKKLRAMVRHAYEHVPYYRRKFDDAGIQPGTIKSVEDLAIVPITTKNDINRCLPNDVLADNINRDNCVTGVTSGSTGHPLTVVIDRSAEDLREAQWSRAYVENGLRIRDKMATIKDPHHIRPKKRWIELLGILRRKEISIFVDVDLQMKILESYRPDVLKGYSSSLAILADFCRDEERERPRQDLRPHSIYTGAELLLEGDRKLISSTFGCDVLDYYGSMEFSLLAWECQDHMGHHMNTDCVVIEFVKDGDIVGYGERGELVCTSLVNYAMPLIRYRLGDIGVPVGERCSCGRSLPLLKMLEGRADDFLTAVDGRIISPTVFSPYPFRSLDKIRQFRVVQEARDKLTIQVVPEENFLGDGQILEEARRKIERVFGEGMRVDFQILERIDPDPTGKRRKIVSHVPVPWRSR